jgi:hypothetical protein
VNKLRQLQDAGVTVVVLLADVQAFLSGTDSFGEVATLADATREHLLSLGLDSTYTEFYRGSQFQFEPAYVEDLFTAARHLDADGPVPSPTTAPGGAPAGRTLGTLLSVVDPVSLDADVVVVGPDDRGRHDLLCDALPALDEAPPAVVRTPRVTPTGRGGSSDVDPITTADAFETIREKVAALAAPTDRDTLVDGPAADSPMTATPEENPVGDLLAVAEYVVFPQFDEVVVDAVGTHDDRRVYESVDRLREDLHRGDVTAAAVRRTLAYYLDRLFRPR